MSALKKVYEKSKTVQSVSKSTKSCGNIPKLAKKHSVIVNPKYLVDSGEHSNGTVPVRGISPSKSLGNLTLLKTGFSGESTEDVELSISSCEVKTSGLKLSETSSKLQELKLKNKRTRLQPFPWHSSRLTSSNM